MNDIRRGDFGNLGRDIKAFPKKESPSKDLKDALEEIKEIGRQKALEDPASQDIYEKVEDSDIIYEEPAEPTNVQQALDVLKQMKNKSVLSEDYHEPVQEKYIIEEKEIAPISDEKKDKIVKISNTYAGIGGLSRLKVKETPKQSVFTTDSEKDWEEAWFKQGEEMSEEMSKENHQDSNHLQNQKQTKSSFFSWKGIKNKFANLFK